MNMRWSSRTMVLLVGLVLAVGGCKAKDKRSGGGGYPSLSHDLDGTWNLVSVNGTPAIGDRARLSIDGSKLSGYGGCNGFHGLVHVDEAKGALMTKDVSMTARACADKVLNEQEGHLMKVLWKAKTFELSDETLTVTGDGTAIFTRDTSPPTPDRPLEGVTWTMSTWIDGETASAHKDNDLFSLTFNSGRVVGTVSCNELSGRYAVTGDTITFSEIGVTEKGCGDGDDVAELSQKFVNHLNDRLTFKIEKNQLALEKKISTLVLRVE